MNRLVGCLTIAGLAIAVDSRVALSAKSLIAPSGDVEILVGGAPQPRYPHGGRFYVEAIQGREYAVRLRNPYPVRVAVALSVDGLNTIDARQTTASAAQKWVLDPYEVVTISGWQTSRTEARRFVFTTESNSYGQRLGLTANLGVISAVFFKERAAAKTFLEDGTGKRDQNERQPAAPEAAAGSRAKDEYAATGMGRTTDHAVTRVYLDLESAPAQTVNIRYEFRPQLVRLGILPAVQTDNTLERRERARGFDPGFCPVR
jgi:hypothetical protein